MAKKTSTIQEALNQRRELFEELRTNGSKSILNRINNSITNEKKLEQVISDDAVSPGNQLINRQTNTVYNAKLPAIADCIGASSEQEIADILDRFADELIVYNDSNKFCEPDYSLVDAMNIDDASKERLKNDINKAFDRVYRLFKYSRYNIRAKKDVIGLAKEWLTIGKVAYFIVYDNVAKPKAIKDIIQIDLRKYTLVKHEEYVSNDKNSGMQFDLGNTELVTYWSIHENTGVDKFGKTTYQQTQSVLNYTIDSTKYQRNTFLDSEIAVSDWGHVEFELSNYISYVSMLLRPFNIMRIMERTRIIWAVMNSRFRTMYVIPVKGTGRIRGKQTISEVMNEYKDHVDFNNTSGEIKVNGNPDIPFNKEIWLGETSAGVPQIKNLNDSNGPDLSDVSQLTPYSQKLQKASKLPMSRFEDNNSVYWDNNPLQISIEERRFSKYIDKVQQQFGEPLKKAMYQQLLISNTNYIGDVNIYDAISIKFNRYNQFERLMEMEVLSKTIEVIGSTANNLKQYDEDGYEIPVIAQELLVEKYIPLTKADKERNEELLKKYSERKRKAILNGTMSGEDTM